MVSFALCGSKPSLPGWQRNVLPAAASCRFGRSVESGRVFRGSRFFLVRRREEEERTEGRKEGGREG